MKEFAVYSKIGCPYCTKIISVLELSEQRFVEYKLGRDFTKQEFFDKFGQGSTFPRVTFDGELLGGCVESIKYLRENKLV